MTRDSDDPPNPFNNKDAGNLVAGLIDDGTFPEPDDDYRAALYVVFLPQQVGLPGAQQSYSFLLIWVDCIAFQAMSTMTLQ